MLILGPVARVQLRLWKGSGLVVGLFQVVKFDDVDTYFAWRFENTDVKRGTTVVVAPEQIAFWVSNGRLVSVLGPGKHKVEGNYVQGLSWVSSRFAGGDVPSSGEIWFVSTGLRNIKWGTPKRIPVNVVYSNAFREMVYLAANGNIQVSLGQDPERIWAFINNLKGSYGDGKSVSSKGMADFIKDNVLDEVKASLAEVVAALDYGNHVSQLPSLGEAIRVRHLVPLLSEYGLVANKFQVKSVEADSEFLRKRQLFWDRLTDAEAEKFERMRRAEAERYGIEQTGYGMAASRQAQGYSFQEERHFDVFEAGARNEGVGGDFTSASVGMAMGSQMGGVMGGMFMQAAEDVESARVRPVDDPPPPAPTYIVAGNLSGDSASPAQTPPAAKRRQNNPAAGSPARKPDQKFCIHCGTRLAGVAKFCSDCGGRQ